MSVNIEDIGKKVVSWAEKGEQVEAFISRTHAFEVTSYETQIEDLNSAEETGIGIRIIRDGCTGRAHVGSLDERSVKAAYDSARQNVNFSQPDEFAGLAEPDGIAPIEIGEDGSAIRSFSAKKKTEIALQIDSMSNAADSRIAKVINGTYGDAISEYGIFTSTGINAIANNALCYTTVYLMADDGTGPQTAFGVSVAVDPAELDLSEASGDAVARAVRMLGATKPKSADVSVIFDQRVTPTILGSLSTALNGESVAKGRSFWAESINKMVAPEFITFTDNPTLPEPLGRASFDGEGLASRSNVIIQNGKLENFLLDSYSARRLGFAPNAMASRGGYRGSPSASMRAAFLEPGNKTQDELISEVDFGVLVQSVLGASTGGINPITGSVSLGAEGLLIQDGSIAGPIREFTIAGSAQEIMANIRAVGSDLKWLTGSIAGVSLLVDGMMMAGN